MGQKRDTFGEGDSEIGASERICLQSKKKEPRFYVIKSKRTLTVLTRLVFLVLTLFSAAVITTSIWLMLDCRESFATVRPMLPRNIQFCTNMGMPALFSCCTVLFAIFGLGCTGRRLTGYALIIISCVEILQSFTALTFYKCNAMSRKEVMGSVNSSLLPCYVSSISMIPFASITLPEKSAPTPGFSSSTKIHHSVRTMKGVYNHPNEDNAEVLLIKSLQTSKRYPTFFEPFPHKSAKYTEFTINSLISRDKTHVPLNESNTHKNMESSHHLNRRRGIELVTRNSEHTLQQRVECTSDSRYFVNLSKKLNRNEINNCLQVCQAYKAVCPIHNTRVSYSVHAPSSGYAPHINKWLGSRDDYKSSTGVQGATDRDFNAIIPGDKDVNNFEKKTEGCGYRVFKYVSDLCYYDNRVILPISLCAPFICIAMSACFIYLAYCDRRIKDEYQPNIFIQVQEDDVHKPPTWSISDCCHYLQNCFKSCLCQCHFDGSTIWERLVCCSNCVSSSGNLSSEHSTSTHELLHLRTMPSSVTVGSALTPEMSQYTLNTTFDDCSPILPRRS